MPRLPVDRPLLLCSAPVSGPIGVAVRSHRRALRGMTAIVLCAGLGLLGAGGALAGPDEASLAPPGPCAEPREARAGTGLGAASLGVGPLEALFVPADVAAPPPVRGPTRPATAALIRPGACDVPGSGGCGLPAGGAVRDNPPARPDRPTP